MPAAIGPRFVLEAGFLILLAVVVGFADLSPALIILVMAIAWVLVALIEYFAWRQGPAFAAVRRSAAPEPAPAVVHEEVAEEMPPAPPPVPPAAEEETIIEPSSEAAAEPAPTEPSLTEFRAEPQQRMRYSLEPLQPRPRRRWGIFGPRERREAPAEGDREEER
jgi:hypothetical protein